MRNRPPQQQLSHSPLHIRQIQFIIANFVKNIESRKHHNKKQPSQTPHLYSPTLTNQKHVFFSIKSSSFF